ncbi:MAG: hypothetical protein Q4D16_15800 [Eubacteriales bacterium]|nr:hypothetical protein [Eubacteriales bacterium]
MEQILSKLSEIEITAKRIMEDADRTKKALSEEMEKKCKDFDAVLETETNAKIQKIRAGLEHEKDTQLTALRKETETTFSALDSYYEKNHKSLSEELFQKILKL